MAHGPSVAIFISQIVALLIAGRVAGELLQRIGQPPVTGQILAGMLLGPSVLGVIAPSAWQALFPDVAEQKAMLNAVSELGILLLLLLTGMETDLSVFRDARRPAISISLTGIVIPFICGCVLGELLPDSMLPATSRRLITVLFLGTALSISSVKIVALVIRDLGFLRRTVGQVIIASAILDDTIGWIIMSITFGLAAHGTINVPGVLRTVVGTALFLVLSFTLGRRFVFRLVRWSNDTLASEMATVSTMLVIAGMLALLTTALGVHFVLGTFVAGILIGQSPILTRRLEAQLRGLIIGLFMPVFFTVAGMTADLAALAQPRFLWLTGGLIALASVGKFLGAFLGGRLGGLSYAESFAVGCGMNARGSTEVIVASLGLQVGALNLQLYTAIVAMAIVTTTAMPPMLRWAFSRLPLSGEERSRLEREEFEERAFLPQVERLVVAVDSSPSGGLASYLAGLVAGARRIPTTVVHLDEETDQSRPEKAPAATDDRPGDPVPAAEDPTGIVRAAAAAGGEVASPQGDAVEVTARAENREDAEDTIASAAQKAYSLLWIGREPASDGGVFSAQISRTAADFEGAIAIAIARGAQRRDPKGAASRILVTVSGTRVSRNGAELAITLAQAAHGSVTALHVDSSSEGIMQWRHRFGRALAPRSSAAAAVREIVELGEHYGIEVRGRIRRGNLRHALLHELAESRHDLLVLGVSVRPGDSLFLGDLVAQMLERARCSLVFVSDEAPRSSRSIA
jgi:Kef-type K+ transport system membrane component KefB/nucleotide-binding universal stress UspA family protein